MKKFLLLLSLLSAAVASYGQTFPVNNLKINGTVSPSFAYGVNVRPSASSTVCNGGGNDGPAFTAALAASPTIHVSSGSACVISSNLVIPNGTQIWIDAGATISVNTGITLTIRGLVEAPPVQIFTGLGTVTGIARVLPEWWGATGTGIAHNDAPAFQLAENSMQASHGSDGDPCLLMRARQYGIGSPILVTPSPSAKVCWKGAGSGGINSAGPTLLIGLASFTGGNPVISVLGGAGGASSDWDMGDFAIQPQTIGAGPTAGIQIGYTANTLQGAYQQSIFRNITIFDFAFDWDIGNARLIQFDRISGWEGSNTTGTSLRIATTAANSNNFTGDIEFIGSQFIGASAGNALQMFSTNGGGATIAGVKFHGTDFYIGNIALSSTNGGDIQDIWFDSGFQYDGINAAVAFSISSSGAGSLVKDIHITDGYLAGAPTIIPVNISSSSSGTAFGIYIKGNMMKGPGSSSIGAYISVNGVTGLHIENNDFVDVLSTAAVLALSNVRNAEITNNTAEQEIGSNSFPFFVAISGASDYYNIVGNLSNGVSTSGTALNNNISNGAAGSHVTINGNW